MPKYPLLLLMLALASQAQGQTAVPISLPDSLFLNETQSVITPHMKDQGAVNNTLDVLSGKTAGVNVTSDGMDHMATLNSVRVRGTTSITGGNDPLVVIDGVVSDVLSLNSLYPGDIESFSVLKNAAETSKFGSLGASGVIVVKTKRGTGKGFQISYDGSFGLEHKYKTLEMLSASEYVATANQLDRSLNLGDSDTNFFDAITRTGTVQNHHLAFSGGSENTNYRASFAYIKRNNIIQDKGYSNLSGKIDVTQKAFDGRLQGDFGIFGSSYKNQDIYDNEALFYSAATMNPTLSYEGKTKNTTATEIDPPLSIIQKQNDTKNVNINVHLQLKYRILPGFYATAFGSFSHTSTEVGKYSGAAYRSESKNQTWLGRFLLEYGHTWGDHDFKASLGTEYHKETISKFWVTTDRSTTKDWGYYNMGAANYNPIGGTAGSYADPALFSLFADASYTYRNRYTVSLTTRGDASSMVGENHTWACFPSVSASWDMKKEPWLKDVKAVSMLKLNAGFGLSGNLGGITSYASLNTVQQNGVVPVNGAPTVTLGTIRNNNPDLSWERKTKFNVGVNFGTWNNRLVFKAEYYYSRTNDMLYEYDVPVPPFTYSKLLANIGSMENYGLEFGIGITPVKRKDLELNIDLNVAYSGNKLLSLSGNYNGMQLSAPDHTCIGYVYGAGQHGGTNNVVYQMVGQPLGVFYLPHCKGLIEDGNGHYRYDIEDLNGDGEVDLSDNGGDRYVAGQATPKVTMGVNISLRYKDWYLTMQFNGAFGHKIFNGTALAYNNMSGFPSYNVLKGAPEKNIVDQNVSDYWLESGDYVHLQDVTIGYNIPMKGHVVKALRVSCSVNNLFTITGYSGLTPIINSYVVNRTMGMDDKRNYPLYRTFSIGASIQF